MAGLASSPSRSSNGVPVVEPGDAEVRAGVDGQRRDFRATARAVLYRYLVRPFLYALPAETAHHLALFALRVVQTLPLGLSLLRLLFAAKRSKQVRTMGLVFPTPVGLAAGFDKDARVAPALFALGFGSVEVGTVTAEAQPGNPRPRLFRLIEDRALLNRMGFNNEGAEAVARRLSRIVRPGGSVLGVNIGKSKVTPADAAVDDYEKSARLLGPYADYLVVNVSSPNTPGLRDLQAVQTLRPILEAVRKTLDATVKERKVPLLVKIAPDLADEDIRAIARMSLEIGLDGIIATNTTISRNGLSTPPAQVQKLGAGGVSGAPLKDRSLEVLHILSAIVGSKLTLVAAGGIETADDVERRLRAGAQLVQIYSSLVFFGPGLPGRLAGRLAAIDLA